MIGSRTIASRIGAAGLLALGAVFVAGGTGCSSDAHKGYAWGSSHDRSIRTIHVPMFDNRTFSRGLEVEVTDAIVKEIQRTTPWRVVRQSDADTTLSGTISASRLGALSTGEVSGIVQEQSVTITLEFDWKDNATGKVIVSRRNFSASDIFVPSQGVGERLEAGQNAAVQRVARSVVAEMRSTW